MWTFLGILSTLISFVLLLLAIGTGKTSLYVALIVMVLIAVMAFVQGSQLRKEKKRKKELEIEEKLKRQAKFSAELPHSVGLPIAEKTNCQIYSGATQYEIVGNGNQFNIDKSKITDVSLKTDIEIQKQVSSSVGGAVGGAVLFGPLGAMIGGRAKQRNLKTVTKYLIFTYNSDGEVKYVAFDATAKTKQAKLFVGEFKTKHAAECQTVNL